MNKKLLAALVLSIAMAAPQAKAEPSALETAINDPNVSVFNLTSNQIVENDLAVLNREFSIVDQALTYEINGYGNKGFVSNNSLGIFAKSVGNFSTTGNGGIICMGPNTNLNIYGAREAEEAKYILTTGHADGMGGAVYLGGMGSIVVADKGTNGIRVSGNDAKGNGGAFALVKDPLEAVGGFLTLRNTSVDGNYSQNGVGGGIYSDGGNVKVQATNGIGVNVKYNIAGDGNYGTGQDIYAKSGSDISLTTDGTAGSSITVGDVYLDNSRLTKSGNVVIDNLSMNNSVLHTADGVIDTKEITALNVTGANNTWTLDADFDNEIADQINANATGGGTLNLELIPTSVARGDIESLDVGLNSVAAGTTINTQNLQIDETMYNLSLNDDKTVKITLGQERAETLQGALRTPTADSYTLEQSYATSSNLGELVNNEGGNRTFTINGKDGEYYHGIIAVHPSQESDYLPSGIKVTDGETLNLQDVAYFSNFRKKDGYNPGNGAAIEAYNANISITNPNNPNKTEFRSNTLTYAKRGGGAIYAEGGNGNYTVSTNSLTIDKAVFKNNYSGNYGGAIYAENIKDINITNTDFINNKATDGGSIYIKSRTNSNNAEDAVNVNMENVTFNNNGSRTDLEISITDKKKHMSTVNIKDAEFTGKTGGAWSESLKIGADEYRYNIKSATLDGINLHDNKSERGITVTNTGSLTLKNSTIANNVGDSAIDPIIYINNVDRTLIDNTTFDNNRAVLIETHEDITIQDSAITNNILNLQHGDTGMIKLDYSNLTMNLDNLTVDNNEIYSKDTNHWADGIFENYGSNSTINFNGGTYTNNKAHGNASIITGELKSKFVLNDVKFQNNSVENNLGGMIGYAQQDTPDLAQRVDIWINAVDDNVVFSGNSAPNGKVKDLYVATSGKAYLNASAGRSINMEDIYVEHRPDALTWDSKKFPTQLYLNDKEGSTGTLNIGKITLENGADLLTTNGRIDTYSTIGELNLVGEASKLYIDANLSTNASDKFTGIDADGSLKLAVSILTPNTTSAGGSFTVFTGDLDGLTILESSSMYGDDKYTFTQSAVGSGVINYQIVKDRSLTLRDALADITISEYDMPDYTVVTSDLGNLAHYDEDGYFVPRTFTIKGNNGILITDGQEREGISIPHQLYPPEEDFLTPKLIVNDLDLVSGFTKSASNLHSFGTGGAIDAEDSVLELHNVTFSDNIAKGAGMTVDTNTFGMGGAVYLLTRDGYERVIDPVTGHYIQGDHFKSIIENTTFLNNKAISTQGSAGGFTGIVDGGGAVFSKGDLDLTGSLFANNAAISAINEGTAEAGALYLTNNSDLAGINCNVMIDDTMFMSNIAGDVINEGDALTNTAAYGGALMASRVDLNISNSQFVDNIARAAEFTNQYTTVKGEAQGGAIHVEKMLPGSNAINIDNTTFALNKTEVVKSVDNGDGTYTLTSDGVSQSKSMGGAIAIMPSNAIGKMDVYITNSDFVANESGNGGAIYNQGSNVVIKDSSFTGNQANHYYIDSSPRWNEDMRGGAIYNASFAKLTLDGVDFSENYAQQITYDGENNPIITAVKQDIRNDASSSGGLYFIGNASALDGGITGTGYTHFNLGLDEFGNVDPNATDTTMTIGAGTSIVQTVIEVNSGTVNVEDANNITARSSLVIGENGTLNIAEGNVNITNKYVREIENNGTLSLASGYLTDTHADEGLKDLTISNNNLILASIDNKGTIKNYAEAIISTGGTDVDSIINNEGKTIINAGDILTATLTNNGTLTNGVNPDNPNEVVGAATISGDIINNAAAYNAGVILGDITNNENGNFQNDGFITGVTHTNAGIFTNDAVFGGDIVNSGTFTNNNALAGGLTNSGDFTNNANGQWDTSQYGTDAILNQAEGLITNNGTIVSSDISNTGTFVNAGGIGTPEGGTAVITNNVDGSFANTGIIDVTTFTNRGVTSNKGSISAAVTNQVGTFTNDGLISGSITNEYTSGDNCFVNNGIINAAVTNTSAKFMNNAVIVGDFTNSSFGKLDNTDGAVIGGNVENVGDINNLGAIAGNVENHGKITNNGIIDGDIQNYGDLMSKLEDITGTVTMNASSEYVLINNGITIDESNKSKIQGDSGKLQLFGDIVSDATADYVGTVVLNGGATLIKGDGDAFQSANRLLVENNNTATLSMANGTSDTLNYNNPATSAGKLEVEGGSTLNLEMDYNDKLVAKTPYSTVGNLALTKIDLRGASAAQTDYQIIDGDYKDKVVVGDIDLITDSTSANYITYNAATGSITAVRDALANVINDSQTAGDESAYYTYSMTSNEAGSSTSDVIGNLKINGHGYSLENIGLTIGNGTKDGNVIISDANISNVNVTGNGALTVNQGSSLTIRADEQDVNVSGTTGANKNAIYLAGTAGDPIATVMLEANNGNTITFNDDVVSNNQFNRIYFNNGNIIANGLIDPITAVNTGADVTRGGQDIGVTWQLFGGNLKYLNDSYLSNATNDVEFKGGTLNLMNGATSTITLNNLQIDAASNLFVDANLEGSSMDKFNPTTVTYNGGTLNVAGINLLNDANKDKTTINFTSDATLMGNVNYTGSTVLSRIFKYNTSYDNTTGDFEFNRMATGNYNDYNPSVLAAPIAAQLGGYLTQLNSYEQAFMNMDTYMMMPSSVRTALKMRNKIASLENAQYDDTKSMYDYNAGWFRPYATFETVALRNGPNVRNNMYGSFFGGESSLKDLGHGWDGMWGAYIGYNGSHQSYDSVGIYQNGGTLGLTGMAYKDNFFVGGTVNVGAAGAEASTAFGSDDFAMLMTGAALKTGYNWELANGKFIIQPSLMAAYSFVNTFNYRNSAGVAIESDPLHAITIEPGIKFIGNLKNGWQPYAGVSMVFNIMDRSRFQANDVSLPNFSVNPFVRYGIGVRKTWGERLTGHFQTYFTNGGRNGVGLSAGLRWAIGKQGSGEVKGQTPELKPTKITLNNHK